MATPAYRYLLCDLLTDRLLAVLPLRNVSFDRRISRTGALQATMDAPNAAQAAVARLLYNNAGRSALWVYRDGALWWGGIPWTTKATQGPRGGVEVEVQAATFDSYVHHRRLYVDANYLSVDQGAIVWDLWNRAQGLRGIPEDGDPAQCNIGVLSDIQPTGVQRDRLYLASDHNMIGKLIEDLGDVIDGPEHTIDVFLDADGTRVKRLRVANRLGLLQPRTVFQRAVSGGGRVQSWTHTADAVDGGTVFQTRGDAPNGNAGEEVEPLLSAAVQRTDLLDAGWPLLDVVADYTGVKDTGTLDGYAQALAQTNGGAQPTSSYTVEVGNSGWSPNRIGDTVRLKLNDLWHDNVDLQVRPVGCQVTPPDGTQPETVTLLLDDEEAA